MQYCSCSNASSVFEILHYLVNMFVNKYILYMSIYIYVLMCITSSNKRYSFLAILINYSSRINVYSCLFHCNSFQHLCTQMQISLLSSLWDLNKLIEKCACGRKLQFNTNIRQSLLISCHGIQQANANTNIVINLRKWNFTFIFGD